MFRLARRIPTPARQFVRCYASQSRQEPPKLRYIVAIAVLGTGAFILSANKMESKMPQGITEEEYQQQKTSNRLRYKRSAFQGLDVVFLVGAKGCGKTTQCEKLTKDGYVHVDSAKLINEPTNTKYAPIVQRFVQEGRPVPQDMLIALIHDEIQQHVDRGQTKFVIDGFPEDIAQAMKFEEDVSVSKLTVYLDCPAQVLTKRVGQADSAEKVQAMVNYFNTADRSVTFSCDQKPDNLYNQIQKALKDRHL